MSWPASPSELILQISIWSRGSFSGFPYNREPIYYYLCLFYLFAFSLYHLNGFELLMLKYVLGYSDLIFVPLLIILMDPDVRGGVCEVCR